MDRILTWPLLGGALVVVIAAAALSLALPRMAEAHSAPRMACVDSNGNGTVDRAEVIAVIRLYFSGDPIPCPGPDPVSPSGGDKWVQTGDRLGLINSAEDGSGFGPWYMSLSCQPDGNPGVYIRNVRGRIYSDDGGDFREIPLKTVVGTVSQPETWFYFPVQRDWRSDYFAYGSGESLITAMMDADEMTVTTPYTNPSTVTFPIVGLSGHIDEPSDLCTESNGSTSE